MKKQLVSFLGLCGDCRCFAPGLSLLDKPLGEVINSPGVTMSSLITSSEAADNAFVANEGSSAVPSHFDDPRSSDIVGYYAQLNLLVPHRDAQCD